MKSSRAKHFLLAGAAALLMAIPAASQETPESLLPPGFSDPETLPPPAPKEAPAPDRQTPTPPAAGMHRHHRGHGDPQRHSQFRAELSLPACRQSSA